MKKKLRLKPRDGKERELIAGSAMIVAGIFMLAGNLYVATPFHAGGINIGGFYIRTGIFILPLVFSLMLLFSCKKKTVPTVLAVLSLLLLLAVSIASVSIRINYISIVKWIIILLLVFGGAALLARSLKIYRQ